MINYVNLELFSQSSIRKDIDMLYDTNKHINNNDVVSGSFNLNESACSTKELKFGALVSSKMSVKLYNTIENLMDKELSVSLTINKDSENPFKMGKYTVKSDKPTSDRLYKQIEAYDGLYDVIRKDVSDWYESLAFPLTQKAFRDSFFNYVGLTQVDVVLINDNMIIEKTISTNTLSGKDVLSAICELNGAIGRINREGLFEYVFLNPNPSSRITINKIQSGSGSYEDYECKPISKVQIRQEENDIGAIVGTDGNTYIVQDNFLVYGKSSTDLTNIATNLLSVIRGITYRPFKVKAIYGNPCYEIGDALTVVTRNATFNTYMLNRTLNGINAMSDTIKAEGVEEYTENLNSTNTQFQQLKRRTNELTRTVEETKSTITKVEAVATEAQSTAENAKEATKILESQVTQQAEEIESKVSKTDYTGEQIASLINQTAESIKILAEHIGLEGLVTINGKVEFTEDGRLIAKDGEFKGSVYANYLEANTLKCTNGFATYQSLIGGDYETFRIYGQKASSESPGNAVITTDLGNMHFGVKGGQQHDFIFGGSVKTGNLTSDKVTTTSGADLDSLNNNYNNLFKVAFFGGVTTDNFGLFDTGISSSKMPCGIAVIGLIGRLYNANSRWYVQVVDVTTNKILPNYTVSIWFYYLDTNIIIN